MRSEAGLVEAAYLYAVSGAEGAVFVQCTVHSVYYG